MKISDYTVKLLFSALFICFYLIFEGCGKNNDHPIQKHDTIKPLSYFPVFPGSYWQYYEWNKNHPDTIEIRIETKSTYILHQYPIGSDSISNQMYVPYWNNIPVYGYDTLDCDNFTNYCNLFPALSEKVGYTFGHYVGDPRYNPNYRETVVIDKRPDQFNDSILLLRTKSINKWEPASSSKYVEWNIFKKNIGLIYYFMIDTTTNDTIIKKWLVSFHIN